MFSGLQKTSFMLLATSALCGVTPAFAADSEQGTSVSASSQDIATSSDAGVIIVTARRREENLQDVPIAVTAFQGNQLESRDIGDVTGFSDLAPNVTLKPTASLSGASNAATFFIRGIGQTDFAVTTDPGVGTYVDGMYLARSVGGVMDTLDVESIEVLRGPQGTLFGRNTIGGAINIRTRKPSDDFSFDAHLTVGSRNRRDIALAVDLPVNDALKFRASALSRNQDGFVRRLVGVNNAGVLVATENSQNTSTLSDTQGNKNSDTFRITAEFEPSDGINFLLTADSTTVREESAGSTAAISSAGLVPASALAALNISGLGLVSAGDPRLLTGNIDTTYATGPNGTSLDIWGVSLTSSFEIGAAELKLITAYRSTDGEFNRDGDGTPFPIGEQTRQIDYEQLSQEIQLNGTAIDDRLDWTLGAYYFDEHATDFVFVSLGNLFGAPPSIDIDNIVDNSSLAFFGQGSFELTDRLSITGGLRWTQDKKQYNTSQVILPIALTVVNGTANRTFDAFTGRIGLEFKTSDNHLLYAAASRGFKSGGFTPRYVGSVAAPLSFNPETVWSYEVGSKFQGLDNRLRLNTAAFYSTYSDIQLVLFDRLGAPINQNGGDATIWGIEAEGTFVISDNFKISGTTGYIDAQFDTVLPSIGPLPFQPVTTASRFPNTPSFQSSVTAELSIPVSDAAQVKSNLGWIYSSSIHQTFENDPELFQPSYHMLDFSIAYEDDDNNWSLTAGIHNLTNKRIIIGGGIGRVPGFGDVNYNAPREWYVTLRKGF